jgi:DNA-directed RNA polymerase specialized sigma24 family protein
MSAEPQPNGRERGNGHEELIERELHVLAQARQLRERPVELVNALAAYVGYELGRRTQMGQLDPEDLRREEVIDHAFAAALTRLSQGHIIRDLHSFLRSRAQDMIRGEVRRVQYERRQHVSLDAPVASGEVDEAGEVVRVADTLPDLNARDPEQIFIDAETLAYLINVLSDIPDLWRTVFLQRTMQERSARDVAEREGLEIDEVRRITVNVRDILRERMLAEFDEEFE